MAQTIEKLSPNQDLQCYFQQPSAVAALSATSATGFTVSGSWREQFDWAVIEWNRDNGFEHPLFRTLPDGDLSGLVLTYEETRTNCMPMDSNLGPTVGWPYLRVWRDGQSLPDLVPLYTPDRATAIGGTPTAASATLTLTGTATNQDYIGVAWLTEQYNYQLQYWDSVASAVSALAQIVNDPHIGSPTMSATASGTQITLTLKTAGANGNLVGVYGFVSGAGTESWSSWWQLLSGGASPTKWRIHLDLGNLTDINGQTVTMTSVRKMRWTYVAPWQDGAFQRTEFEVQVSNWTVTGTNRAYSVAGPGSRRIEDDGPQAVYSDGWTAFKGSYNYSNGSYHSTETIGAQVSCTYWASVPHSLYLGAEFLNKGASLSVTVDGGAPMTPNLLVPTEDALVRIPLGQYGGGTHTVVVQHAGPNDSNGPYTFNFDFLEIAIPTTALPELSTDAQVSLATDWDTYHSICLAPERTAWMIDALGFHGRVNHYMGALWFYELVSAGFTYASAHIDFTGPALFALNEQTSITIDGTTIEHVHYIGDTAETVVKAFEMEINRGTMSVRAVANGAGLTIYSRSLGLASNSIVVSATSTSMVPQPASQNLTGGQDGTWLTDLQVTPRLNRAARDWTRSFFRALKGYGLDGVAALSMELGNGDPSLEAGIAQRTPDPGGVAVWVSTPALQTNFSPASIAFWQQAYQDIAQLQTDAGLRPYLQFGEVQWWYFRDNRSGMPFYDAYTTGTFLAQYGRAMQTILDNTVSPADYPQETQFLPTLIGAFTSQIMAYVRASFPTCRFEVLYPLDVNDTDFNRAINYPAGAWTPAALDCLKTESFGYTGSRDLNQCLTSIQLPGTRGFSPESSAHLVGIGDPTSPWLKEVRLSKAAGLESVVLFALDQLCLIGYSLPLPPALRRASLQG
ncbi:MAG TPA: hypothetical protein VN893_26485 [Bryobacteraceae bacterium]|nr:hypothetical protein [Bryobacteraceae bacterium]